jgi:hypothetical protein
MKCLHGLIDPLTLSEVAVGLVVWMEEGHDELEFLSVLGFLLLGSDESLEIVGISLDFRPCMF